MEPDTFPAELLRVACTRGQSRVCQLLRHATTCNRILCRAGLQLGEDVRYEPGDMSVTSAVPGTCAGWPIYHEFCASDDLRWVLTLLRWLLTFHRCVVSLETNYRVAKMGSLFEILASSTSLKRLIIFGTATECPEALESLASGAGPLYDVDVTTFTESGTPAPVPVQGCAGLTSLDVASLFMCPRLVRKLIDRLMENATITELAVGACVFARARPDRSVEWFVRYLTEKRATLRKLTLRAMYFAVTPNGRSLLEAISAMTSLRELTAQFKVSSQNFELFMATVIKNRSVRSLNLRLTAVCDTLVNPFTPPFVHAFNVRAWASELQENDALDELVLDIAWASTEACCAFLRTLAANRYLRKVTLRGIPHDGGLPKVCGTIREYELADRVFIEDHRVGPLDLQELPECLEVTAITLSHGYLPEPTGLVSALDVLTTCSHVTSVTVLLCFFHKDVYASLSSYVRASKLKDFELRVEVDDFHDELLHQSMSDLCEAFASNRSLNKITLDSALQLRDKDFSVLADAVLKNRRLYELSWRGFDKAFCAAFLGRLLPGLVHNYSLLVLKMQACMRSNAALLAAQDVVLRNCSLVQRATGFVMGDRDAESASALEHVYEHPKLVENVRVRASLNGEAEAVAKIRNALRVLYVTHDIHDYMKMAGVVMHRVVCYQRDDGSTQLDQLHHDCWVCIRRYLKVSDVLRTEGSYSVQHM
ncbi:hypothetical protein HPB50_021687 [Hyalomma asiaticum]|uniref:Uncharacterized protein n=1 Tax=Hyalomma asiaticum TaxID=266040 RepID=A0ACB7T9E2_HYAAI|nr:hypothetical protein HPB50_021687 [Hyalomma asiaticum]